MKNKLFEQNIKLVYYVWNKNKSLFSNLLYAQEDFIASGLIGLYKSCMTFDESKGYKFNTYAYKAILNEMLMHKRKYKYVGNEISYELPIKDDITIADTLTCDTDLDDLLMKDERYNVIQYAIDNLFTDRQTEIFLLYLSGLNTIEISKKLSVNQSFVYRYIKECNKKINSISQKKCALNYRALTRSTYDDYYEFIKDLSKGRLVNESNGKRT